MLTRKTPVKVLKCGPVISKSGNSCWIPDARVVDFGCKRHFGLAEVKSPETKYHVTPLWHERFVTGPLDQIQACVASKQQIILKEIC